MQCMKKRVFGIFFLKKEKVYLTNLKLIKYTPIFIFYPSSVYFL